MDRGTNTKITFEGKANYPIWTPDGSRVVLGWWNRGQSNLWWKAGVSASAMERLIAKEDVFQVPGAFSPDGENLAFVEKVAGSFDIAVLRMHDRQVTPLLNSRFHELFPDFSPDGRWLAYTSSSSEPDEVYVQSFPGPGTTLQISPEGGSEPIWAPDGKKLYYRRRAQVWAVDVQTSPAFSAGRPHLLFENSEYGREVAPIRSWDISRDGHQFLMIRLEQRKPAPTTELTLVQLVRGDQAAGPLRKEVRGDMGTDFAAAALPGNAGGPRDCVPGPGGAFRHPSRAAFLPLEAGGAF